MVDKEKLKKERIRRLEEKIKANIDDFAKGHSRTDGKKVTVKDLEGVWKVYDVALRKLLATEKG